MDSLQINLKVHCSCECNLSCQLGMEGLELIQIKPRYRDCNLLLYGPHKGEASDIG